MGDRDRDERSPARDRGDRDRGDRGDRDRDSGRRDEEGYKLFVGGVPWSMDDRALRDHFADFRVIDAKIIEDRDTGRSRGFGFVTMEDEKEGLAAIDKFHNTEIDGRPITVNKAGERGSGGGGRGGGCFTCGEFGHRAAQCSRGGGGGGGGGRDRYGGGGDRYGGGGGGDRYRDRSPRRSRSPRRDSRRSPPRGGYRD